MIDKANALPDDPASAVRLRAAAPVAVLPARARGPSKPPSIPFPTPSDEAVVRRLHMIPAGPLTRGECADWARPCVLTRCTWNTATFTSGRFRAIPGNCVLDLADAGEATLDEVAEHLGCTRERVRQIEEVALRKLGARESVVNDGGYAPPRRKRS
jgi:hypothetical protein